jgi:molecular chaperone DnaJ
MEPPDRAYYDVLGLTRAADRVAIRKAFLARAREVHPDVSDDPDAERKFREVAEAYDVLSRPTARLLYDRYGYRGRMSQRSGTGTERGSRRSAGAATRARAARPVSYVVEITLAEAVRGTTRKLSLPAEEPCLACDGPRCARCDGSGRIRVMRDREVRVPAGVRDGERLDPPTGTGLIELLVRVAAPPDPRVVRYLAAAGFLVGLALMVLLLLTL